MSLIIENGDCLELMKSLPDNSVDLFICDLPYGETNCKWDSKIDLEQFWEQFRRLRKSKRTACIHFCSTKFGYTLIKSWEGGYKMDMVWKKRNKTGGLQSRNRPMRNHEMVYFFYEQAPKYNRDKYHKRIVAQPKIVKDDNASVVEEMDEFGWSVGNLPKENRGKEGFEPRQPASVVEEEDKPYGKACGGKGFGATKNNKDFKQSNYEPPNPASVVEEKYTQEHLDNNRGGAGTNTKSDIYTKEAIKKFHKENGVGFEPPNPASVVIPAEDEPVSMFESTKVFIGKRHHQTEKPQDILEFFIKYWTDEGDTILDPTMGSGSTGVACNKLKRNFIGFELDKTIFKVAEKRVNTKVI